MSHFSDSYLSIDRKTLEWKQIGLRMGVPRAVLDTVEIHVQEQVFESLMMQLRAYVLADHIADETFSVEFDRTVYDTRVSTFRMPATWWDHWKRDKAPRWLRKRLRPVRWVQSSVQTSRDARRVRICETATIERHFAYPDHTLALPRERFGQPVLIETWRGPEYRP